MGAKSSKNVELLQHYLDENDYYNIIMFVNNDKGIRNVKQIDGVSPLMYYYKKHIHTVDHTKKFNNSFDNEYGILKRLFGIYKNDLTESEYQRIELLLNLYYS